jgi:hypothetical protein
VAALEDGTLPRTQFRWTSMHSAEIAANLQPEQLISVQMSWSGGWHATVNGRSRPVERDGLGLMYVDAATAGPCQVSLIYDGGVEMFGARVVSFLTMLLLLVLSARGALRRF